MSKRTHHFSQHTLQQLRRMQRLIDRLDPAGPPAVVSLPGSPEPEGDIIIFSGSFNPPTQAHIAMLKQARLLSSKRPLHIYAAMNKQTTDKETVDRPILLDRLMLLRTVLRRRLPHAGMLLFNRGLYVEQAEAVRQHFHKVRRLFFLMGFDKIVQIFDPRYYHDRDAALRDLFRLAELVVAPRGEANSNDLSQLIHKPENEPFARYIHALPLSSRYRDISSTQIRQGDREALQHVPQEVRHFIATTRVYAPPLRLRDGTELDSYAQRIRLLQRELQQRL
ncbi:hypothetical protein [Thermosporothrix hazakensis]|jgi:nicotinic acid mononucleotide adenylyltransferase|nr:hypothetical protein [Thermosporothrix hazakensis]